MINLAGNKDCDEQVVKELNLASISIHRFYEPLNNEVPTRIMGYLGAWTFTRAWYYWVAEAPFAHGVPKHIAIEFNKKWFSDVRVDGFAGGKEVDTSQAYRPTVESYHIDTQEGLNAFADMIKQFDGREGVKQRIDSAISRLSGLQKSIKEAMEELQISISASR
jgi:hypothetical protein